MADGAASIQGIEFEIKGSVDRATNSLQRLRKTLNEFKGLKDFGALTTLAQSFRSISSAAEKIKTDSFRKLASSVNAVTKNIDGLHDFAGAMREIASVDYSNLTNAGEALKNVASALESVKKAGKNASSETKGLSIGNLFKSDRLTDADSKKLVYVVDSLRIGLIGLLNELKNVAKASLGIIKRAVQFVLSIPSKIKSAFSNLAESVKGKFQKLGTTISDVGKGLREWYQKSLFMKPLREAISGAREFAKRITTIASSFKRVLFYRAVRTLIKEIGQAFKEGVNNLYEWSNAIGGEFASNMDRMATSILYLKNSLGAMVAPLLNALAPALDYVIDKIVDLLNVINQLFARLTGASYWTRAIKQATGYADAAGSAGSAAKEAMRYLAPFDELNVLPDDNGRGRGSGSGAGGGNGLFEEMVEFDNGIKDFADRIREAFQAGDWQTVGTTIGEKLNEVIDGIDWESLGGRFGYWINGIVSMEYWTMDAINFESIGENIAAFVNNALEQIDASLWGGVLTKKVSDAIDLVGSFLLGLDASTVGTKIHDFFTGMFNEWNLWASGKDASEIGNEAYERVTAFFNALDLESIARSGANAFSSVFGLISGSIGTFIGNVGAAIKAWFDENLKGQDWKETAQNILTWIGEGFVNIATWVDENMITPFMNAIGAGQWWTNLKETGATIWAKIKEGFPQLTSWISTFVTGPIGAALVSGDWSQVKAAGGVAIANIKSGFPNFVSWVGTNIVDPIGSALFGDKWESVKATGKNILKGIGTGLQGIGPWVKQNLIDPIVSELKKADWEGLFSTMFDEMKHAIWWNLVESGHLGMARLFADTFGTGSASEPRQIHRGKDGQWYNEDGTPYVPNNFSANTDKMSFDLTANITSVTDKTPKRMRATVLKGYTANASKLADNIGASGKVINNATARMTKADDYIPVGNKKIQTVAEFTEKVDSIRDKLLRSFRADLTDKRDSIANKTLYSWTADLKSRKDNISDRTVYGFGAELTKTKDNIASKILDSFSAKLTDKTDAIPSSKKVTNGWSASHNDVVRNWKSNLSWTTTEWIAQHEYTSRSWKNNLNWTTSGWTAQHQLTQRKWNSNLDWTTYGWTAQINNYKDSNSGKVLNLRVMANGGAFYGGKWHTIPQYAGGTRNAHGSLFIAGEAGPEVVSHIGGRTEVLNQSQLAATMYSAVAAGMASAISGMRFRVSGAETGSASMYDEAASEMMYNAMVRALETAGISVEIENHVDLDGAQVYESVVRRNDLEMKRLGRNRLLQRV